MIDIQTISIVVASASVAVGIFYYALEIRHQTRMRETDLVVRLAAYVGDRDFMEAVMQMHESEPECVQCL